MVEVYYSTQDYLWRCFRNLGLQHQLTIVATPLVRMKNILFAMSTKIMAQALVDLNEGNGPRQFNTCTGTDSRSISHMKSFGHELTMQVQEPGNPKKGVRDILGSIKVR